MSNVGWVFHQRFSKCFRTARHLFDGRSMAARWQEKKEEDAIS